jgi:hypothetical protein
VIGRRLLAGPITPRGDQHLGKGTRQDGHGLTMGGQFLRHIDPHGVEPILLRQPDHDLPDACRGPDHEISHRSHGVPAQPDRFGEDEEVLGRMGTGEQQRAEVQELG